MSSNEKPKLAELLHPMIRNFCFDHIQHEEARAMSKLFFSMAVSVSAGTHQGREQDAALRKLLEAKDAALRAIILDCMPLAVSDQRVQTCLELSGIGRAEEAE